MKNVFCFLDTSELIFQDDCTFVQIWKLKNDCLEVIPEPVIELMKTNLDIKWRNFKDFYWRTRCFSFVGDYAVLLQEHVKQLEIRSTFDEISRLYVDHSDTF